MDANASHHSLTPASYGHACMSCSKAKSRCIASNIAGAKCERCRRLNKECQPSAVVRKRKALKNPPATKTTRLEEKLDGLVSLLQGANQPVSGIPGSIMVATQTQKSFQMVHSLQVDPRDDHRNYPGPFQVSTDVLFSKSNTAMQPHLPILAASDEFPPLNNANSYIPRDFDPPQEETEEHLQTFRNRRLKHFPFLNIPSSTTSRSLRHHRPFLWYCIMTVCSTCPAEQLTREIGVRTILGRQMLLEGDRSLDLLLGLLVYIAWGQSYQYKPKVSILVQMALALLGDLGLQRNPPKESPCMMLDYDARGCPRPLNPTVRSIEERRVALACFLHVSTISAYFQKIDPPRWSAYLETCLQAVIENKEDLNDALLALIIRLQLIVDRVAQAPWQLDPKTEFSAVVFYIRALEAQLEDVRKGVPGELERNETYLLHLHYATLTVHEVSLSRSSALLPNNAALPSSNTFPTSSTSITFDRLSSLSTCLYATKSWFITFLSFPSSDYPGFTTAILTQMTHSIIVLYRLSTFEDADWDLSLVRDVVDLGDVLDRLLEKTGGIIRGDGHVSCTNGDCECKIRNGGSAATVDNWASMEKRLRGVASWWRARIGTEDAAGNNSDNNTGGRAGSSGGGVGSGRLGGGDVDIGLEFWDDSWLDVISLRDYHF